MIGIYEDDFLGFLKQHLSPVKTTSTNIICRCPFCELRENKNHYHLYISLEAPIFHCFHCEKGGVVPKLLKQLTGRDVSEKYVNDSLLKEKVKQKLETPLSYEKKIIFPPLNESNFKWKTLYINHRLKYPNFPIQNLKGLVFDINKFIEINSIPVDPKLFRMKEYLQTNFVGFATNRGNKLVLRNIDNKSDFRYFKLDIKQDSFLDYYKLSGGNYFSNNVVFAEGIFDILVEHIFDNLNLRSSSKLYAAGLSTSYSSLLKSIVFNEQIFKLNVSILSDSGIPISKYKELKQYNEHLIESLVVYYNKAGKDFAETPVVPERIVI